MSENTEMNLEDTIDETITFAKSVISLNLVNIALNNPQYLPNYPLYCQNILLDLFNNKIYPAVIEQKEKMFVDGLNKIKSHKYHSDVCILKILYKLCVKTISDMNMTIIDTSSFASFMESCEKQILEILANLKDELIIDFSHECENIDITQCDATDKIVNEFECKPKFHEYNVFDQKPYCHTCNDTCNH